MNKPKYNRCDCCGRNPHKIAIRFKSGHVDGLCPSCYDGRFARELAPGTSLPYYDIPYSAWLDGEGATILYDRRTRKGKSDYPLGVSREATAPTIADPCDRCGEAEVTTVQEHRHIGDPANWKNTVTRRCDKCAQALRDYCDLGGISMYIMKDSGIKDTTLDGRKHFTEIVYATMADGITYRVTGECTREVAMSEWQRLDDLRCAGYLPQVKFVEVRSIDETGARFVQAGMLDLNRLKATLSGRGFKTAEAAAREAWKLTHGDKTPHGSAQGTGGWFYTSGGRPVAQGLWCLANIARQQRLIVQGVNGRWYVTDIEIVAPQPTVEDINTRRAS